MKIRTVLKQPPPNFFAPYPAINALKKLFICTFLASKIVKNYSIKNYYCKDCFSSKAFSFAASPLIMIFCTVFIFLHRGAIVKIIK